MKITLESFDQVVKGLNPHMVELSRGAGFFGGGVFAGILIKQFLRLFLLSAIVCFFVIKGLEYNHILNIDWGVLNQLVGLRPSTNIHEFALLIYKWAIKHPSESIAGSAGLLVGYNIV